MALIIDAMGRSRARGWLDLMPSVVAMFRDGDTLRPVEAAWLADWLAGAGLSLIHI